MKRRYKEFIVILFFAFLSIFIFRDYFLKNAVPFPSNLLASFYQPWISYKWEGYPNGPPSKPVGFDNLRIFYPLRKLTIDQIKNKEWPLWNPYNFSGNTHLGVYHSSVFHPLGFLFFLLPQIDAWSLIVILQPFLSGIFMYLFLREISLSRRSSLFGGVVFAFSGFMIVWWEENFVSSYSALFLPLILYSIEKLFKKINIFNFLLLTFSLTFCLISGWFQMSFYVFILSLIWIVFRLLKSENRKRKIFYFTAAFILSFMISAIHLMPGFESFIYSARGTTDAKFVFDIYLMPLSHLVTFLAPDFFGNPASQNYFGTGNFHEKVLFLGIVPLVFGIYEIFHLKKTAYSEKFFKYALIITLSLGFALPTSWFFLYYLKIPLVSVLLPSRIFFISTFSLSILAAFGLERYLLSKNDKKIFLALFIIGVVFTFVWAFIFNNKKVSPLNVFSTISFRNFILPSAFYAACLLVLAVSFFKKSIKSKSYFVFLSLTILSSLYFANKYLYFSERKFIFPEVPVISALKKEAGIDRFWGVGNGYIDRNFATYFNLFSPEGYDSFYIGRYGELLFAAQNKGKYSRQIPRTDATLTQPKKLEEVYNNSYRRKLLSLLGVRYIVAENKTNTKNNSANLEQIWKDGKFNIYKNKEALPRFFIASDYKVITEPQEILNEMFNSNTDLFKTVILEEKLEGITNKKRIEGTAKLISYSPNKVVISTELNKTALLFLSDNYFPGWKAYVDSNETKIYRADYSFRAVVVPVGNHIVSFKYEPASFYIGVIITLFGLLATLIVCITIRYISYKKT